MDGPEWRDVQRVVDGALDRSPESRDAYIDEACGGNDRLRESAKRLVEGCDRAQRAGGILASPAIAFAAPLLVDQAGQDATRADERNASLIERLRTSLSGRYTVERELGRGGMATVFLARDLRHDRAVAVKVLGENFVHGGAERFLYEIRTAARLTHPHVLGVHDSGEADGALYYVMPYVAGETLRARLQRDGALPLPEAIRLIRELADALAYAHKQGVMHRDLKPENVLISGGHAVVADFGIAKALAAVTHGASATSTGLTSVGVALGTPAYMAPEQAVGDLAIDHRADLYALGVVAYEALAGTHPFGTRSPQELVAAHLTEAPALLATRRSDVPPALAALVTRLLAKDPNARPQSADAVLQALDEVTPSMSFPRSRTRAVVRAATAALLVVAAVAGYTLWQRAVAERTKNGDASSTIGSVAVMPFVNTSGNTSDDYFSDGMTDELVHALTRLPGLRLAGRTSAYSFKGKAVGAQEIGRVLDVRALVLGTVRRAGDRLRVSTQLVSAADGKVLWDSVYESRSSDVFAVQDEFTRAIVAAIAPSLGARKTSAFPLDAKRGTADQEAFDLYLRGRYYFLNRNAENIRHAIAYFREAIAKDPLFARAHASLALAYGILPTYIPDATDSATALNSTSAQRAVALDSTLADAHIALGISLERQFHYREAEARYRRALALEPSSVSGHHVLGFLLSTTGRTDEASVELGQAARLDPLAKSAGTAVTLNLIAARRFPEALATARRSFMFDSTFSLAIRVLGLAQAFGGHPDSAIHTLERGARLHPDAPGQKSVLLFAYAASGRWEDAERLRARLRAPGGDPSGGVEAAFAELIFGNHEPLLRLVLTEAGQRKWRDANGGWCNPLIDPLWADARFRAAMRALTIEPCPRARAWPIAPRRGS